MLVPRTTPRLNTGTLQYLWVIGTTVTIILAFEWIAERSCAALATRTSLRNEHRRAQVAAFVALPCSRACRRPLCRPAVSLASNPR
jgi:hypothetical protein